MCSPPAPRGVVVGWLADGLGQVPGPSLAGPAAGLVPLDGSLAVRGDQGSRVEAPESGFGRLLKVNLAASPLPSVSTVTIDPGRSSPNRIFTDSMSSISRWIVLRSGRAPSTGSYPRSESSPFMPPG